MAFDSGPGKLFGRRSWPETARISGVLRQETVGGALLIGAAIIALVWANSPAGDAYAAVRDYKIGPAFLSLDISIGHWASDGLLAIFFFVAGLELKREFVAGDLRDPSRAALPIVAAVGGMAVPAALYVAINALSDDGSLVGWAIPSATDIAFALAVLAIISTHLPSALRTFLLTLAVVDDLLAIVVIAFFYTTELNVQWLLLALVPLGLFAVLVQRRVRSIWLLVPLALVCWGLVHASGVHATVAGVLLGFTVPVLRSDGADGKGLAEHFEHLVRPISAGIAVPIFAFFAAGVAVGGLDGMADAIAQPITLGIIVGLVVGKVIGVFGSTYLMARFTRATLDDDLAWADVLGLSMLAGIGFTVSLLIGDLAFGRDPALTDLVKVGVLLGSLLATFFATILLRSRNRVYRDIAERESRDEDADGIPDLWDRD